MLVKNEQFPYFSVIIYFVVIVFRTLFFAFKSISFPDRNGRLYEDFSHARFGDLRVTDTLRHSCHLLSPGKLATAFGSILPLTTFCFTSLFPTLCSSRPLG